MSNQNLAKTLKPRSWRSQTMHDWYESERQQDLRHDDFCPLCEADTILNFEHWRIIPNKYPYDAVARKHDQLVPKQHLTASEISSAAWEELEHLKQGVLNEEYSFLIEALPGAKSIPGHFHLHLMVPKRID